VEVEGKGEWRRMWVEVCGVVEVSRVLRWVEGGECLRGQR